MWTNIFLGEFSFIPSQQSMILSDTDRPCHHHQRDIYNTTQDKYKIGQPFYRMARFARLIYLRLLLSLAGRWSTGLVAGARWRDIYQVLHLP